jgi:alkanesulfonate monooxygenase SsuD/methylene tetrahydromethanopterin reductase-like flavin-dependent oxidoreductase (luciferase family)
MANGRETARTVARPFAPSVEGEFFMKLAYFTMPLHPPDRDYVETLKEDREAILLADRLGFTEAYVGEHVTDVAETITDSVTFLASLAHDTKTIKLATGTVNLPNGHPAAIASRVAMLDNILVGRFIFGISPGGLPSDWEIFGNLKADRREKFQESIDQILTLWTTEGPYDIEGKYWNISTAKTTIAPIGQGRMVKPYQRPHPPIVVTAAEPSSASVANAARRGWEVISANFLLPEWVRTHWDTYVEGCEAVDRTADPADWRIAKNVFVAEDGDVAREYAFGPDSPYRFYYDQLGFKLKRAGRINLFKASDDTPDEDITTDYLLERLVIAGTPEEVTQQLLAFRETVGDFGTLLYCGMDWVDPALARRSMELMAEKVLPAINEAIGADRESAPA